jgi:sulfite exporter TauE/SafE
MTALIQGFLLGLANGGACLTACAPILVPYMVSEGRSIRHNALPVFYFLCGRLGGYLAFAVFAWEAGKWIRSGTLSGIVFGLVYAALGLLLVLYGFHPGANPCAARGIEGRFLSLTSRRTATLPALMGLLTGLSLCPPFVTAIAAATNQASLFSSLLYFLSFFMATTVYLIPLPFLGLVGRSASIRIVGRLAAGVVGCYLLYESFIMFYGGLRS